MDTPELDVKYVEGGKEYLKSLRTFGLDPLALFWAYDEVAGHFVLVLVSDYFDAVGPYAMSRLLFRAYNASVTPKSIDPFIIRLHSPFQNGVRRMVEFASGSIEVSLPDKPDFVPVRALGGSQGGLQVHVDWAVWFGKYKKRSTIELTSKWDRISRKVDRLAA